MRISPRGLLLPVIVLVSLLQVGCGGSSPTEHIAKAQVWIDQGDYRAASIELSNALQQDPNLLQARLMLGQVAGELGDWPRAEKEVRRALDLGLPYAEGQPLLVEALALQGSYDAALEESTPIADGVSVADQAAILGWRGQAHVGKGQFDIAETTLSEALEIHQNSIPALLGMALIEIRARDYDGAREWLGRALAIEPQPAKAWSLLGQIELELGDAEAAETALTRAIELQQLPSIELAKRALARSLQQQFKEADQDLGLLKQAGFGEDPYFNYVVGVNHFGQGDFEQAAEAFQRSAKGSPPYLPREYYLAASYLQLGRLEQAQVQAELVNSMAPRWGSGKRLLGAVQLNQSELGAATEVLTEALQGSPEDITLLRMLGDVALLTGDSDRGIEYYERALALDPESAEIGSTLSLAKLINGQELDELAEMALADAAISKGDFMPAFVKALAKFRDGDVAGALSDARGLDNKFPDNVNVIKLLAVSYLRQGQLDRAIAEFERVLKIQPNEPSAATNLARLEAQTGNPERARTLLREVVKAHPGDEQAILALASVESELGGTQAALAVLEQAHGRTPDALLVTTELARVYASESRFDKVIEISRLLTDRQFAKAPALLELRGRAQMQTGDFRSAQYSFGRLTKILPDSAAMHFLYANSLAQDGDVADANAALQRTLELDPAYLPARIGEIKLLVQREDGAAAKERLAALRKEFGPEPAVLGIEGWFAMLIGDFTTAEPLFAQLIKPENEPDTEVAILYARSLWGQEKYDAAMDAMVGWLQEHPRDLTAAMYLAGAQLQRERSGDARDTYARIVEIYPDYVPALNNVAWLYREDNLELALGYAEHAAEVAPNDPAVLDTLGMLLLQAGDKARGQKLIENAARRAPGNFEIQLHYAEVLAARGSITEVRTLLNQIIEGVGAVPLADSARRVLAGLQ